MLKKHKGGFILSYNDCPTIRKYYKGFKKLYPKWQYTMGQGETRIGKNRIKKAPFAKKTCNPKSKSWGTKPTPEKNIPERIPKIFVNLK